MDRGKSGDKQYSNTFVSSSSGASSSKDADRKKHSAKLDDDNDYPNCEKRSSHTFKSRTSRERSPSPTSPKRRHRKSRSPSPTSSKKRRRRSRSRSPSNKHSRGHYESTSHSKHYGGGGGGDRDRASGGKSRQQARYDMMQQCLKQQEEQGQVNLDLTVAVAGTPNQPQPTTTNTAAKLVQEIEKRKSLFSKKAQSSEPTGSVWNSTSLTNDSDGKMTAKFKRLMGIKGADTTTGAVSTEKPQTSNRNQEEYLANLEKQYEVARTITHTQRGVGLGFGSSGGMSSSRQ